MLGKNLCLLNARGQWIVKWVSLEPFISRHVPKYFAGTAPSLRVQPCCCSLQPRRDRGSVCIKAFSSIALCLLFIVRLLRAFQCSQGWGTTHPVGVCRGEIWRILSIIGGLETASACWRSEVTSIFPGAGIKAVSKLPCRSIQTPTWKRGWVVQGQISHQRPLCY